MPPAAATTPAVAPSEVLPEARRDALMRRLHGELTNKLDLNTLQGLPEERRRGELRPVIDALLDREAPDLSLEARDEIAHDLQDDLLALGPLERLLRDPTVGDILI